jgi:hypothetical protein
MAGNDMNDSSRSSDESDDPDQPPDPVRPANKRDEAAVNQYEIWMKSDPRILSHRFVDGEMTYRLSTSPTWISQKDLNTTLKELYWNAREAFGRVPVWPSTIVDIHAAFRQTGKSTLIFLVTEDFGGDLLRTMRTTDRIMTYKDALTVVGYLEPFLRE